MAAHIYTEEVAALGDHVCLIGHVIRLPSIDENSHDVLTIILPTGKFRYCTLPQGASVSSYYFNICTDNKIRNALGDYKNIDDVLVSANNMGMLEERMKSDFLRGDH